jgi:hypothetical protein
MRSDLAVVALIFPYETPYLELVGKTRDKIIGRAVNSSPQQAAGYSRWILIKEQGEMSAGRPRDLLPSAKAWSFLKG